MQDAYKKPGHQGHSDISIKNVEIEKYKKKQNMCKIAAYMTKNIGKKN